MSAKTKPTSEGTKVAKTAAAPKKKTQDGFSVGEKVKVVEVAHLTDEDKAMSPKWVDGMNKFSGSIGTIVSFNEFGRALLDIDDGEFKWRTEWLSKLG